MYGNYGARQYGYDSYGRDNYGNYYGNYGNYGESYGRRGQDMRYRGHEHLDKMYEDYGRYEDGRQRYGANDVTLKSLEHMLKSAVDFFDMLKSEANTQEEVNMVRQYAQKIAQM